MTLSMRVQMTTLFMAMMETTSSLDRRARIRFMAVLVQIRFLAVQTLCLAMLETM